MNLMSDAYLQRLTGQLADGVARLPEAFRQRHARWIRSLQNPDGGFPDREGGSDLYYTGFALRTLAVLQALDEPVCQGVARFLQTRMTGQTSVVDFFSFLLSAFLVQLGGGPDLFASAPRDWPDRVADLLETFRTPDGGYAKTPQAAAGSTYHTFLVMLTYQLLDRPFRQTDDLIRFVQTRRRQDGGYVEFAPMRRSGTNPTAAAIGILQLTQALTNDARQAVIDFLTQLPSPIEGGLRANDRIPVADLLSTFTGSWTLAQLDALDRLPADAIRDYARRLEVPTGGFRGGLWDNAADVEYTFYGIGVTALLA